MFTCRACFRKVLAPLLDHALLENSSSRTPRRNRYSTAAAAAASVSAPKRNTTPDDDVVATSTVSRSREWAAQKELQYLNDPLHIAERVKKSLSKDRFEEAALITRMASKNRKVAVSWNYLIDYRLRKDELRTALKLFNEMKKRAQIPNPLTYTIMFRGFAKSKNPKVAVAEAVKLYQSMMASTKLQPNTIHMNAALQVCAKAQDLESFFTILQTADERSRSPNYMTYTTTLNALRANLHVPATNDVIDATMQAENLQTVQRAKSIWDEAMSRWRSGAITIDEELVCAVGRILLMGNYADADYVEKLLEQTMGIPREDGKGNNGEADKKAHAVVRRVGKDANVNAKSSTTHAKPGNNSLSLILEALQKTGKTARGERYWVIFTKTRQVKPDSENWSRLLQLFHHGNNSGKTIKYMQAMPKEFITIKHLRIAMDACLLDNLNKASFNHATQVLEMMRESLRVPNLAVLRKYLRIAYANRRAFGNSQDGATAWAKQMVVALDNLWNPYRVAVKQSVFDRPEDSNLAEWLRMREEKGELVALVRRMIAAYDRLINENLLPRDEADRVKPRRNNLNKFVVASFEERSKWDSRFNYNAQAVDADHKRGGGDDWSPPSESSMGTQRSFQYV